MMTEFDQGFNSVHLRRGVIINREDNQYSNNWLQKAADALVLVIPDRCHSRTLIGPMLTF